MAALAAEEPDPVVIRQTKSITVLSSSQAIELLFIVLSSLEVTYSDSICYFALLTLWGYLERCDDPCLTASHFPSLLFDLLGTRLGDISLAFYASLARTRQHPA
jgi:hypothetical protein